ncbi:MAG: endo alpha-1,4 polygalactosaminidase [Actinobacteria bacterium]|nr:endo alpha-1,4 polygalactosaminidase [Actinomycetota bacterium]
MSLAATVVTTAGVLMSSGALSKTVSAKPTAERAAYGCRSCRKPPRDTPWEYRLQGTPRVGSRKLIYDIDGVETPRQVVRKIHRAGGYAICYVNAGSWESWRTDKDRYPSDVLGRENGWPGERYVDIRRNDVLVPILRDRFRACQKKGFDAVEPDNVDGYLNESGFPITADDQLNFNRTTARLAHDLRLAVGLKNDLEQANSLASVFDFAVTEECVQYKECASTLPFRARGKAVLDVEYRGTLSELCGEARRYRFSGLMQSLDLDKPGRQCPRRR